MVMRAADFRCAKADQRLAAGTNAATSGRGAISPSLNLARSSLCSAQLCWREAGAARRSALSSPGSAKSTKLSSGRFEVYS